MVKYPPEKYFLEKIPTAYFVSLKKCLLALQVKKKLFLHCKHSVQMSINNSVKITMFFSIYAKNHFWQKLPADTMDTSGSQTFH